MVGIQKRHSQVLYQQEQSMQQDFIKEQEENHIDFFQSPSLPLDFARRDSRDSQEGTFIKLQEPPAGELKQQNLKRPPKAEKSKKIRTSRNVQKIYHCIVKGWLQKHHMAYILPKYEQYFNQRVYFILLLDEILKRVDGELFLSSYVRLARDVAGRKLVEIANLDQKRPNSEQALHLRRVVEEIDFSIKACQLFVEGSQMEALIVVYQRSQDRITKKKDFERAIHIYREVSGHTA